MLPRVLLVDDDPLAQDLVKAILYSAGFEADIASDGFAALKMLRAYPYRVALIDYHMPEMDGYVLAKLLRDIAGDAPLKLAGMTADCNGLAMRRGVDALFDAIIVKPFEPQALIDLVNDVFFRRSEEISDVRDAAAALLANPGFDRARSAAAAFWRSRGLAERPKIFAIPEPTEDQIMDIGICFDLVEADAAELLVLIDVYGLEALSRIRGESGNSFPPVVTLDKSLLSISDVYFHVGETETWADVANCLIAFRSAAVEAAKVVEERRAIPREPGEAVHHDLRVFRKMMDFVGREMADALLAQFSQMLENSFNAGHAQRDERQLLLRQARATFSAAEQLGFARLADTCRELELALDKHLELDRPLDRVRAAKLRSLRTLAQLRESVSRPTSDVTGSSIR